MDGLRVDHDLILDQVGGQLLGREVFLGDSSVPVGDSVGVALDDDAVFVRLVGLVGVGVGIALALSRGLLGFRQPGVIGESVLDFADACGSFSCTTPGGLADGQIRDGNGQPTPGSYDIIRIVKLRCFDGNTDVAVTILLVLGHKLHAVGDGVLKARLVVGSNDIPAGVDYNRPLEQAGGFVVFAGLGEGVLVVGIHHQRLGLV